MSMNRIVAALCLALAVGASGCATSQKSASNKARAAKVANHSKHKSRFTKQNDADFSLGDVDQKLLKRGQDSMTASAFDSL